MLVLQTRLVKKLRTSFVSLTNMSRYAPYKGPRLMRYVDIKERGCCEVKLQMPGFNRDVT